MENLSKNELHTLTGGSLQGDMAWGALTGGAEAAWELSEFGPAGIAAGFMMGAGYGALEAFGVNRFRNAIGLD